MNSKVLISSIALIVISILLVFSRSSSAKIDLFPNKVSKTKIVQLHIEKQTKKGDFSISVNVPSKRFSPNIINENFDSEGFGVASFYKSGLRRLKWTGKLSKGRTLNFYYTAQLKNGLNNLYDSPSLYDFYYDSPFKKKDEELANIFLRNLQISQNKDLINKIKNCVIYPKCENGNFLSRFTFSQKTQALIIRHILERSNIKAVIASGFNLRKNPNKLSYFIRIKLREKWNNIFLDNGKSDDYLFWNYYHDGQAKDKISINYSVSSSDVSLAETKITEKENKSFFRFFSLKYLPLSHQLSFKLLLLFPLGALVICILRNIIGIPTFGTFLPVLTAVSYRDMGLFWGIILLSILIFTGIIVRSFLSKLRLLMVPRVSATLTIVIILILTFTLVANAFNFQPGLSIRFFPIVIITLLIERISVSIDEAGYIKSISLYSTTLLASLLAFLVINSAYIQYWLFNFPEIILAILGIIILIGRYTGIRLLEIYRFRSFLFEKN